MAFIRALRHFATSLYGLHLAEERTSSLSSFWRYHRRDLSTGAGDGRIVRRL